MKKHLLSLLFIFLPLVASADPVEIDGIYYNLIANTKEAVVKNNPNKYTGSVDIPPSVTYEGVEYSVTSIGSSAFYFCKGLTSVTIPNSVTSVGYEAFKNCPNITDVYCQAVNVPSTNENAFDGSYPEYATLHVPEESVEAYSNTLPWSKFGTKVGLTSGGIDPKAAIPVLIQPDGGELTVQGAADGTPVSVYTPAGMEAGSTVSQNSMARISTHLQPGTIAIVRVSTKGVKVVMK